MVDYSLFEHDTDTFAITFPTFILNGPVIDEEKIFMELNLFIAAILKIYIDMAWMELHLSHVDKLVHHLYQDTVSTQTINGCLFGQNIISILYPQQKHLLALNLQRKSLSYI